MPKKAIRDFPLELPHGPWPLLQATPEDKRYVPIPQSQSKQRWQHARLSLGLLLLDLSSATLKGAVLGLVSFSAIFSILGLRAFWLSDWHWTFPIIGAAVLTLLAGFDLALIILAIGAIVLSVGAMITQPIILLLFIVGGVILRCLIELLPGKYP